MLFEVCIQVIGVLGSNAPVGLDHITKRGAKQAYSKQYMALQSS